MYIIKIVEDPIILYLCVQYIQVFVPPFIFLPCKPTSLKNGEEFENYNAQTNHMHTLLNL